MSDEARMTIGEHLEELRSRLVKSLLAVSVGFVLAFIWVDRVMAFFERPLDAVRAKLPPDVVKVIQTEPYGAFLASMKIAFFVGLLCAMPVIVHHIWQFIAAGLYKHEKRTVKYYVVPGLLLFLGGAALAYFFVMPWALEFLITWAIEKVQIDATYLTLNKYVSLIAWAMIVFGLMFQLPLIMVFLMRLGVVEPDTFARYRRHALVANFALAMMLTPPDVISQVVLAGCMTILYEGAILIGRRVAQDRQEPAP